MCRDEIEADSSQATEERGENARLSSFVGAMALGDLVKSTLGPKVSWASRPLRSIN